MRRSLVVSAFAASILGLGASPALAGPEDPMPEPPPEGVWLPAPPEYYERTFEFPACGDTILLESGDVQDVEERYTTLDDGSQLIEYRGALTVDLTRQSDGAMIDELDISGVATELFTVNQDGTATVENTLFGKSILFPIDPLDAAAFEEAGIPELAYFTDPNEWVTVEIGLPSEPGPPLSVEVIESTVTEFIDLCEWFDKDTNQDGDKDDDHDDGDDDHDDDHDDHDDDHDNHDDEDDHAKHDS